jgi:hypothetical protein
MGPVAATSYPGQEAIAIQKRPAVRAKQEIDYGRRAKGYVFGALWETIGECWTQCYPRRTKTHFLDFLAWVDKQVPAEKTRIDAILDHLDMRHLDMRHLDMRHLDMRHCHDLLLFQIHHPRWEFVYQPKYAAYLNLIEPWWKVLRSLRALALKGRRFETWEEVIDAVTGLPPPPIGTRTNTPFAGGNAAAIIPSALHAHSLSLPKLSAFSECTTTATCKRRRQA